MLSRIKKFLRRFGADEMGELQTPADVDATFVLRYEDLDIGTLRLHEGQWVFEYTEAFKEQSSVKPLVAFGDTRRRYVAESLWPFFIARLPSAAQPEIRQTIEREGLDGSSSLALLRRFGERTIANPFVLLEKTG